MRTKWKLMADEVDTAGGDGTTGAQDQADTSKGSDSADTGKDTAAGTGTQPKWPDDWRQTIAGEDEKKLGRLNRYATPAAMADALLGLQNKISAGELRSVLPKDATPDQINAWRTENGIPEDHSKYEVLSSDKIPEADREQFAEVLKTFHGVNMSNAQVGKAIDAYYAVMEGITQKRVEDDRSFAQASEDKLRAEWGGEYRANVNMVNGLLATAPESVRDLIKTGRLGNGDPIMAHPEVMMWLNGLSRQINPVTTLIPNAGGDVAGSIDEEIAKIEKVMKTNRKEYNADQTMQKRYLQLIEARDKTKAKAA